MIKNATYSSLTVELLNGKMIMLGPRKTQTISDDEFQAAGVQRLLHAGKIYVAAPTPAVKKTPVAPSKPPTKEGAKNA
ncbi:MAG: hypothetical protein WBW69_23555 [Candidatus Korobacteraceae bacterium]